MSIALYRVDDRLIHGQVVVGWGQPLGLGFIVLVDDAVRASAWEQDLYRMGVPSGVDVIFTSVAEAARGLEAWQRESRVGIMLTGDIDSMAQLAAASPAVHRINIGGVHHRTGRTEHLRYVYLTEDEVAALRDLAARGVEVFAQDVPTARAVPFKEFA